MAGIIRRLFGDSNQDNNIWIEPDRTISSRIVGYFGRTLDRIIIKEAIVQRYGTGFRINKDPDSGVTVQSYERTGFAERMNANQIETVCLGLGHKIVQALANLFSEPTQNFSLVSPTDADTSDVSEYLEEMRNGNQFLSALTTADARSLQCGSSIVFVEFVDGRLRYRVCAPGQLQVLFPTSVQVYDRTRAEPRTQPADFRKIDDAACVVICTGTIDDLNNRYVAIFGRSDEYPIGRYVSYIANGDGKDVPEPNSSNTWDWVNENGEIANPLSWYAENNPDIETPEYPIAVVYGGTVSDDSLLPLSDSLMQDSLEVDIAASQIRGSAARNSDGTRTLEKNDSGQQTLPRTLHGDVILENGQKLTALVADSNATKTSWELLEAQMVSIASGYLVPDYFVSSKDHTVEAASGVALKVRSKPMLKFRENRIDINEPSIYRLFEIERTFISLFAEGEEGIIKKLEECEQQWNAGEMIAPENAVEKTNVLGQLYDLGVYDTIETIRVQYNLGSEAEAIDKYEQLLERSKQYPSLVQPVDNQPKEETQ